MKNHIIILIAAAAILTVSSCHTGGSSSSTTVTPTPTVNSTESQLLGTWYESKLDFHRGTAGDTTLTGFDNSCYIQFSSDIFPNSGTVPANYKKAVSAIGIIPPSMPGATQTLWYYDPSTSKLIIATGQYSIITLTSSNLTISTALIAGQGYTYYFHK